jgi:hypothetical protein
VRKYFPKIVLQATGFLFFFWRIFPAVGTEINVRAAPQASGPGARRI